MASTGSLRLLYLFLSAFCNFDNKYFQFNANLLVSSNKNICVEKNRRTMPLPPDQHDS